MSRSGEGGINKQSLGDKKRSILSNEHLLNRKIRRNFSVINQLWNMK